MTRIDGDRLPRALMVDYLNAVPPRRRDTLHPPLVIAVRPASCFAEVHHHNMLTFAQRGPADEKHPLVRGMHRVERAELADDLVLAAPREE